MLVDVVAATWSDAVDRASTSATAARARAWRSAATPVSTTPPFYDPDGEAMLAFSGKVQPNASPSTVVLDGEGRVAALVTGEIPSAQTLRDVIDDVAGDPESTGTTADG